MYRYLTGPGSLLAVSLAVCLGGCAMKDGAPAFTFKNWDQIPDANPEPVEPSRYGNPDSYEVFGKTYHVMEDATGFTQSGYASWYGTKFHGRRTSSGEPYDMYEMTAAHKTLPIPIFVEVTNTENDRRVIVKVNDRGPFHDERIIDLSYAAASKLGISRTGTAPVSIRVIEHLGHEPHSVDASFTDDEGKLYVQVASYSIEESAFGLIRELKQQSFSDVRIHVDASDERTLYKVRIGPLPSRDIAEKILAELGKLSISDATIVNYL